VRLVVSIVRAREAVRRRWLLPGLTALVAAGFLIPHSVAADSRGAQTPGDEDTAELVNTLLAGLLGFGEVSESELSAEVAEAGGVPFKTPVRLEYMDKAELKAYLTELFEEDYPVSEGEADRRTLTAFDLLTPGTDLRALRARVLEENVVGFYDERPDRRKLYVVSGDRRLTPMNQLVLSHELRHALQDQYMAIHDLLGEGVSDYDDRRMALLSLLEGDATFVMEKFLMKRLPGGGLSGLGDGGSFFGLGAMASAAVPDAPPVVRDQLVLPYFAGRDFVDAVFKRGGRASRARGRAGGGARAHVARRGQRSRGRRLGGRRLPVPGRGGANPSRVALRVGFACRSLGVPGRSPPPHVLPGHAGGSRRLGRRRAGRLEVRSRLP
jgi:hypothetical protein